MENKTYPDGVKVTVEWYNRAIVVVGSPSLLIRSPRGASGVYSDGVNLYEKKEINAQSWINLISYTGWSAFELPIGSLTEAIAAYPVLPPLIIRTCPFGSRIISGIIRGSNRCSTCQPLLMPSGVTVKRLHWRRVAVYHEGIIGGFIEKQRQGRRDHDCFKCQNAGCSILDELPAGTRNKGNVENCERKHQETRWILQILHSRWSWECGDSTRLSQKILYRRSPITVKIPQVYPFKGSTILRTHRLFSNIAAPRKTNIFDKFEASVITSHAVSDVAPRVYATGVLPPGSTCENFSQKLESARPPRNRRTMLFRG